MGGGLNAAVAATSTLGWTPVTGIPEAYLTHGYCSTSSWFVPLVTAARADNVPGAFHPTGSGQNENAGFTIAALYKALYGNQYCATKPSPRS